MRPLFYHFGLLLCLVLLALSLSPSALAQNTRSVFYWKEVTVGQKVLISQAGFYPEGFELIDTVGHKILIPFNFETHHVYTLKFAVSPDGTLYFVNQGDYPVLYLPQDGFLVNGLWTDTRWYPFTGAFHPSRPVFLSIAPGYAGFLRMGWYPGLYCYGGFWSTDPWTPSAHFPATPGQEVVLGSTHFPTWKDYRLYWQAHPTDRDFQTYWKSHPAPRPVVYDANSGLVGGPVNFGGGSASPGGRQSGVTGPVVRRGRNPQPSGGQSRFSPAVPSGPAAWQAPSVGRQYLRARPIVRPRRNR